VRSPCRALWAGRGFALGLHPRLPCIYPEAEAPVEGKKRNDLAPTL
jgi:hypothetical protein